MLPFEVVQSFHKLFEGVQVNGQLRKFVVTEVRGDWAFQVVSWWTILLDYVNLCQTFLAILIIVTNMYIYIYMYNSFLDRQFETNHVEND